MKHIQELLDNAYKEILENYPISDERKEVLEQIDTIQYEMESLPTVSENPS